MNDGDWRFADAARVVEESLALRLVRAACSALDAANADSRAAARVRRATLDFRLTPLATRVRGIGILVATACLTHVVLLRWMPERLSPAVPVALWIAVAAAATGVAVAAAPLTNAWLHRRP
jgi:hypothetical protein